MPSPYTINPQPQQDSIVAFLESEYPFMPIIPDGLPDDDSDTIQHYDDASIKPFVLLWFSPPKRTSRGRSFADYKLDSRKATVDVVVVARDGTEARRLMNDISDVLVGFKTDRGGRLVESTTLWGQARQIDILNRPTRWAATNRFDYGVSATKIPETP